MCSEGGPRGTETLQERDIGERRDAHGRACRSALVTNYPAIGKFDGALASSGKVGFVGDNE